ncbi:MAG: hypothetical protein QM493_05620 [Sulfurovum sp.]
MIRFFSKIIVSLFVFTTLSFSTTILSGGSITDGLDLAKLRVGEHIGYTRMVFNINYGEGYGKEKANTPADMTGNYLFKLADNNISIEAIFSGFRSSSFIFNDKNSTRLKSINLLKGEAYDDDSSFSYHIELHKKVEIKAFILPKPSRIILDIFDTPIRIL